MKNIISFPFFRRFLPQLGLVVLGLFLGWLLFGGGESDTHEHASEEVWTCAMHPQIQEDGPGTCPLCGMELTRLKAESAAVEVAGELRMSEDALRLANVQTSTVQQLTPEKELALSGKIKADESRISAITARFPGRVEQLYINFTGQAVRKGQKLASVYSPELITAQQELWEAIELKEQSPQLYEAVRSKLRLWELTEAQIDSLEHQKTPATRFDILAPLTGTVTMRQVSLGDYIREGSPLFEIANLSRVWVVLDAYESDLPWIRTGDRIKFTVKSLSGKEFRSRVSFIEPVIDPVTRVAYIRAELNNPGQLLKPDMFVRGEIVSRLPGKGESLVIPASAVLWTGKRSVVYTQVRPDDPTVFAYREITLGEEVEGYYIVESGLEAGEHVVTNGAFKLDAAAQLRNQSSMMNPVQATAPIITAEISGAFQQQLGTLTMTYLHLKDALVATNANAAATSARAFSRQLGKMEGQLLTGEVHEFWNKQSRSLAAHGEKIASAEAIAKQRDQFLFLSTVLIKTIETLGIGETTYYVQHCPMANSFEGADWISKEETILNPYFGDEMLNCGSVTGTLASPSK